MAVEYTEGLAATLAPVGKKYEEAVQQNELLRDMAESIERDKFLKYNKPAEDGTMHFLAAAQGPKSLAYLMPEATAVMRAKNAITDSNVHRLHGLPTKSDIVEAMSDAAVRDKQLWKLTGNGIKAEGWANRLDDGK